MTGNGRGSPARVVQVGTQESSVWMTPAAWTRTSTSPSPGRGCGASSYAKASGPPRARRQIAFMLHLQTPVGRTPGMCGGGYQGIPHRPADRTIQWFGGPHFMSYSVVFSLHFK